MTAGVRGSPNSWPSADPGRSLWGSESTTLPKPGCIPHQPPAPLSPAPPGPSQTYGFRELTPLGPTLRGSVQEACGPGFTVGEGTPLPPSLPCPSPLPSVASPSPVWSTSANTAAWPSPGSSPQSPARKRSRESRKEPGSPLRGTPRPAGRVPSPALFPCPKISLGRS